MAEGGDLSQSVLGASEEIYDFNCSPCEEDGVYKEAHKYCESCNLYYCKKCLGEHNKFPALKAHVIKDVTSQAKMGPPKTGSSNISSEASHSEPCEHHPEEMIKMYCGEHDLLCCTVCIALDHRDCNDVNYILNFAKGIRTGQDYTNYVKGLAFQRSYYEETKKSIQNERKKLSDIKTETIAEINDYKRELVSRIDELERKSIENVNERYKKINEQMDLTLGHLDELLKQIEKNERDIKHASEAVLFVTNKKTVSWIVSKIKEINNRIEEFEGLSFSLDKSIRDSLDKSDGLSSSNRPFKIHVRTKKEYDICYGNKHDIGDGVNDVCALDNSTLVVTCNNTLKRLDRSFNKVYSIMLQGEGWGVCKSSTAINELAVSIYDTKKVQFVHYNSKNMSLTKNSFDVGVSCKGICCMDDYLYVACGGGREDKVPGHIRKYSMKGNLICTIDSDESGIQIVNCPRNLRYDSIKNVVCISDRYNGILLLDSKEKITSHPYSCSLVNGVAICLTTKNHILVSGSTSCNIQEYDENFRFVGLLLNLKDEKLRPNCMTLDESKKQLVVFFYKHRNFHVYEVEL